MAIIKRSVTILVAFMAWMRAFSSPQCLTVDKRGWQIAILATQKARPQAIMAYKARWDKIRTWPCAVKMRMYRQMMLALQHASETR